MSNDFYFKADITGHLAFITRDIEQKPLTLYHHVFPKRGDLAHCSLVSAYTFPEPLSFFSLWFKQLVGTLPMLFPKHVLSPYTLGGSWLQESWKDKPTIDANAQVGQRLILQQGETPTLLPLEIITLEEHMSPTSFPLTFAQHMDLRFEQYIQ